MGATKKLVVDLEPGLKDFLKSEALARGLTVKDLIVEMIQRYQTKENSV